MLLFIFLTFTLLLSSFSVLLLLLLSFYSRLLLCWDPYCCLSSALVSCGNTVSTRSTAPLEKVVSRVRQWNNIYLKSIYFILYSIWGILFIEFDPYLYAQTWPITLILIGWVVYCGLRFRVTLLLGILLSDISSFIKTTLDLRDLRFKISYSILFILWTL